MAYTKFAKTVRKLMIDADENLSDLAKLFDVSIAYVSSVFTGKKTIPEKWVDLIINHYELNETRREALIKDYSESKDVLRIDISEMNSANKTLAVQFQRKLDNLSAEDIEKLKEILKED